MKVRIEFNADPSVGIYPYSFEMEIPDFDDHEFREEARKEIEKLYNLLDGEFICHAIFEDESVS